MVRKKITKYSDSIMSYIFPLSLFGPTAQLKKADQKCQPLNRTEKLFLKK